MGLGRTAAKLVPFAACVSVAAAPFACGSGFSSASGGGGAPDGSVEVGVDGMAAEASSDAVGDAAGEDAPAPPDGMAPGEAGSSVHGTVVDAYLLPMAGIAVHCQGQTATTGADGTFTLPGITPPYSATVVAPQPGGRKHGYVFEGVARLDPTLQLAGEQSQATQTATLAGTLSTNAPNGAGIVFADFPAVTPAVLSPTTAVAPGAKTYSAGFSWSGHSMATPTVYVLQWLTTDNLPSAYIAFESSPQTLTGGSSVSWNPPLSATLGSGSMTVTVAPASGYVPIDIGVYLRPQGAGVAAPIQHGVKSGATSSTVTTPDAPNATFVACGLQVQSDFDGGASPPFGYACSTGLGANASPTVQPPPATTFTSPPSTATVGTVFDYASLTGGVYFVAFKPTASAAASSDALFVVTGAAQAAIPDLSLLSFVFHSGDIFTAEVVGAAPFNGIDGALGPAGFSERLNDYHLDVGPSASGSLAYSGVASFTAQ